MGLRAWAVRVLGDEIRTENSGLGKAEKHQQAVLLMFLTDCF